MGCDKTLSFVVDEISEGCRIDKYISSECETLSRSRISRLIDGSDAVSVNGALVKKPSMLLHTGDVIEVKLPEDEDTDILPEDIALDILYEDEDLLIVNKPKGMVVHPAPGHYSGTLVNALLFYCHDLSGINGVLRPGIVHRIDRDTTGSLIVCKNDISHGFIASQLENHTINRKYMAIVNGNLKNDEGEIDAPIGRDRRDRKKMAVNPYGKIAVTTYRVLERFGKYTLIECILKTGRTHQIRVHMAHIGHSVLGDEIYGKKSSEKFQYETCGQVLHAKTLGFIHPKNKAYVEVEAPLPQYFEYLLTKLRR